MALFWLFFHVCPFLTVYSLECFSVTLVFSFNFLSLHAVEGIAWKCLYICRLSRKVTLGLLLAGSLLQRHSSDMSTHIAYKSNNQRSENHFVSISSLLQTVYDQYFITLYNIVYTSLPVLAMGIFDQVC